MSRGVAERTAEDIRVDALNGYRVLDTLPEPHYDDIMALAVRYFSVPGAALCLVDRDRLWFKSQIGINALEIPRDRSFCDVAIGQTEVLVVPDASRDPRFAATALVIGEPHIRFFAGAPLINPNGHALGMLGIFGPKARSFSEAEKTTLLLLARQIVDQLELRKQRTALIDAMQEVHDRNQELALHNRTLERITLGAAPQELLLELTLQIEALHPGRFCSVHMLDGEKLRTCAAPSLPAAYNAGLDGVAIGEGRGCCGTAAFRGERVIVEDIARHPVCQEFRQLAVEAGLQSCWSQPIKDGSGKVLGTFAIYQRRPAVPSVAEIALIERYANLAAIVIEKSNIERKVHQLAYYDVLTALPNRRLLEDRLTQAIAASSHSHIYGALLFIDLDQFKTINDTLGHTKGDRLLGNVALRLKDCVRAEDTVARLGGDEFVVMIANLSLDLVEAAKLVETLGEKLLFALSRNYQLDDDSCRCTSSIGATLFRGVDATIGNLMKQADLALSKSKSMGRNVIHFFDPSMEAAAVKRVTLEADLRLALQHEQFVLHYQAQVEGEGRLVGAEALVRWQHPQRGLIAPAEFIPIAEETGLIIPLGDWVLRSACRQLALWAKNSVMADLSIAVNISAKQIQQSDFVAQVLEILRQTNAPPHRLKLELTESLLVDNVQDIIEKMVALRASGIGFSLDDFGTGHSSLSYLKRLPLEQFKIDQSFVRDVLLDSNDASIARTIVALAQSLGLGVIAEGVETVDQRNFLARSGCHAYQGFLFSRPLALAGFEDYSASVRVH